MDFEEFYKIKGEDNHVEIRVEWDKYNSGLLCRKLFTWVDQNGFPAVIKITPTNSIDMSIIIAAIAGVIVEEIIRYLLKRKKHNPETTTKTIVIINNVTININNILDTKYDEDNSDES